MLKLKKNRETQVWEDYIVPAHNPRFAKVSRQTTTRDLGKLFTERRDKLKNFVLPVASSVALTTNHWYFAEKLLELLELFYDSTVVLSGVYYPTSPLVLHHILEIASHLHACEQDHNLRAIVLPMKLKFLKYWQDIPLLYSYTFILDPRAKMRGFFNVL